MFIEGSYPMNTDNLEDVLRKSINLQWKRYKQTYDLNSTEATLIIFENLYRSSTASTSSARIMYDTLIELNEEDNKEMAEYIKTKKQEFLQNETVSY